MPHEQLHLRVPYKQAALHALVRDSVWWTRACRCVDSHYSNTSGVMLADHLIAVEANLERLFRQPHGPFLQQLFALLAHLGLDCGAVRDLLRLVALLHDIGKSEDDKSKMVPHPRHSYLTVKRHSIVGVYAALDILDDTDLLSEAEKHTIYSVIEEHDVSYGLFREFKNHGLLPTFERWRALNDAIDPRPGVGLLYLLLFKLADIHGHANIEDVTWFYSHVKAAYFDRLGLPLPLPRESDIR